MALPSQKFSGYDNRDNRLWETEEEIGLLELHPGIPGYGKSSSIKTHKFMKTNNSIERPAPKKYLEI